MGWQPRYLTPIRTATGHKQWGGSESVQTAECQPCVKYAGYSHRTASVRNTPKITQLVNVVAQNYASVCLTWR